MVSECGIHPRLQVAAPEQARAVPLVTQLGANGTRRKPATSVAKLRDERHSHPEPTSAMLEVRQERANVGSRRTSEWVYCFGAERGVGPAGVACPLATVIHLDACAACPYLVDADVPRARRWSCSTDPTDGAPVPLSNGGHR